MITANHRRRIGKLAQSGRQSSHDTQGSDRVQPHDFLQALRRISNACGNNAATRNMLATLLQLAFFITMIEIELTDASGGGAPKLLQPVKSAGCGFTVLPIKS